MTLGAEAVGVGHSRQGASSLRPPTLMKEATLQCFVFQIKIKIYHFKVSLKFTSF